MPTPTTLAVGATFIRGAMSTIFVNDLGRSVDFYTKILGLRLIYRAGDHFASIDAGAGTTLGLHPASPSAPAPGTPGATQVGLNVDKPIEDVVATLEARGVQFMSRGTDEQNGAIIEDGPVKLAYFADPDGNPLYLCETRR